MNFAQFLLGLLLGILVLTDSWTTQIRAMPTPAFSSLDQSLLEAQMYHHAEEQRPAPEVLETTFEGQIMGHGEKDSDNMNHDVYSIVDSWFATDHPTGSVDNDGTPNSPTKPITVQELSEEELLAALRYAGFDITDDQFTLKKHSMHTPNQDFNIPYLHESAERMPVDKHHATSSSSGTMETGSTSSHSLIENPVAVTSRDSMVASVNIGPSQPAIQRLHAEDQSVWIRQQITAFMSRYNRNVGALLALIARLRSDPNQFQTMPGKQWHRVGNSAIVKTEVRLASEDSPMATPASYWIHWISNAQRSANRKACQLIDSTESLVTLLTHFHVKFLSKLGVIDQEAIRIQNEKLLHWLSNLIFNPPTGFPLIGINTAKQEVQVVPVCVPILSHYLSGSEAHADIRKLSSILIRFWYWETKALNHLFNQPKDLEAAIHQSIMTAT